MKLLQALSGNAGLEIILLEIAFAILSLIAIIFLSVFFMKTYWKLSGKEQNIVERKQYYKEPIPFLVCIILSIACIGSLIYLLYILRK